MKRPTAFAKPSIKPSSSQAATWVGRLIWEATETGLSLHWGPDDYPCAMQLAHQTGLYLDTIKKHLKTLTLQGMIKPLTMSPKRYRWISSEEPPHPDFLQEATEEW
ncbi:MAG: hypothetical protein U0003_03885 [Vampirovibrionales bacterium]